MSITKKRSKNASTEPLRRKSTKKLVVAEITIRDFLGSLSVYEVDEAAARLQAVGDLAGEMLDNQVGQLSESDRQIIKRLVSESKNKYYRQIMKATLTALEQGPRGIKAVHETSYRAVELAFGWALEYFAAFDLYREKLRKIRQEVNGS